MDCFDVRIVHSTAMNIFTKNPPESKVEVLNNFGMILLTVATLIFVDMHTCIIIFYLFLYFFYLFLFIYL